MKYPRKPLAIAISGLAVLAVSGTYAQDPVPPVSWTSEVHVFSIDDLQTDFDGRTYGTDGTEQDADAICGLPSGAACPNDIDPATGQPYVKPFTDKQGVTLYPVDTAFGFNVVDFLGAQEKEVGVDRDYLEGFVGNVTAGDEVVGVKISNSATAKYKVKTPLGTWCQGLGGTSVKCSTEHFSVMEHALSCHEAVPYLYADPVTGVQAILSFPDGTGQFDCANAELDNTLYVLENGQPGAPLTSVIPGDQMDANDNTTVLDDIATSADYSITLKDDGKPLYRWGGLIKRPNDIRLYARIALPQEWKEPGVDYAINSAKLVVSHWITNNPNDQLRPEDLENEAATGRKPSYMVDGDDWTSTKDCYEGDGDFIDSDEGAGDPDAIGAGTVLKNGNFVGDPAGANPPAPGVFSSDLAGGFTNAFYTTIDRDPFEWSYVDLDADGAGIFDFVGSVTPLTAEQMTEQNLRLVSGPRWRLRANKFGQDIPGLEIPMVECSTPPFSHDNIRYEVGTEAITEINLLDWDESEGPSPLATSRGWVDVAANSFVTTREGANGRTVTSNGLPMTDDFDLAVYVKGDRKSTQVNNAQLVIEYGEALPPVDCEITPDDPSCEPPPVDCEVTPDDPSCPPVEPPPATELSIADYSIPAELMTYSRVHLSVTVDNPTSSETLSGTAMVENDLGYIATQQITNLRPGASTTKFFSWAAPTSPGEVNWTITVKSSDGTVVDEETTTTTVTKQWWQ